MKGEDQPPTETSPLTPLLQSPQVMDRSTIKEDYLATKGVGGGGLRLEHTPTYDILSQHNLLTTRHRVNTVDELDLERPNSNLTESFCFGTLCCLCTCCWVQTFQVPNGSIRPGYDGRGNYVFFDSGVYMIQDLFYPSVPKTDFALTSANIENGDRAIITVPQGCIGFCTDRGQPVLLPPGMHQWKSSTLKFQRTIDLNEPVIALGPWTLLTIDQGYMAVTQDNGKQHILDGGAVYLLTHRNWKFEKFVSTKIQTDELKRNEAASADNVVLLVDATVLWRIKDVDLAVRMSAETMGVSGDKSHETIVKLRNDVLKQAEASLAFFVGTINFSDSLAAAALSKRNRDQNNLMTAAAVPVRTASESSEGGLPTADVTEFNLYNNERLDDAVVHANEITLTYGVEIISINIISAIPKDKNLQESLAAGAVAAAEAQMMETTAQGRSRAIYIEAQAEAKRTMIVAEAESQAEVLRAEGSKKAADLLAQNDVSVQLAQIDRTGAALSGQGNHSTFFFGNDPTQMSSLLANPNIVYNNNQDRSPTIANEEEGGEE